MSPVLRSDGKPAGPLCRATDACTSSRKAAHCKSCVVKARWEEPGRREAMSRKVSKAIAANPRPRFKDETRSRSAVLYATVFGLKKAGQITGIDPKKISLWRRRVEEIDGVTLERLKPPEPKLSMEKARDIRAQIAAGEKQEYLALVYGVSPSTILRVAKGALYPELKREEDVAAWEAIGQSQERAA